MKHVIAHDLDLPTARRVVDRAFATYAARFPAYEPSLRWATERRADITFSVKGISLNGTMELEDKSIAFDLHVPLLLRPFQSRAVDVIEAEVRAWVDKARAGQL